MGKKNSTWVDNTKQQIGRWEQKRRWNEGNTYFLIFLVNMKTLKFFFLKIYFREWQTIWAGGGAEGKQIPCRAEWGEPCWAPLTPLPQPGDNDLSQNWVGCLRTEPPRRLAEGFCCEWLLSFLYTWSLGLYLSYHLIWILSLLMYWVREFHDCVFIFI